MYEIYEDMENNPVTNVLDMYRIFLWDDFLVHKTTYVARLILVNDTHVIFEVVNHSTRLKYP